MSPHSPIQILLLLRKNKWIVNKLPQLQSQSQAILIILALVLAKQHLLTKQQIYKIIESHTGGGGGGEVGFESVSNCLSFFGVFRSVKMGFLAGCKYILITFPFN